MAEIIRVVVADDDELDMRLTTRALSGAMPDAEVMTFEDGESALSELQRLSDDPDATRPVLVLFDYRMPKLGCLDVMQRLDDFELWEEVPLVLFSSSVGPSEVERCMQLGVRAYVEKPTDPDKYREAVRDICGRYVKLL